MARTPGCTYRVQLSKDFTFDAAGECMGYLASLGVTHLYCSPIFQSAPGSTHGYDVVDPARLNEGLGGEKGFRRLVETALEHGIGLLVDIVPNHMATAAPANRWWWDILEHGRSSRYASYFDIDWEPAMSHVKGKVLLGVLQDRYGRELEAGRLTLEAHNAGIVLRYRDDLFPIAAETLNGADVDSIVHDLDAFDSLLQRQHYRLAFWRTAQDELNYRRFFTVDSLIGLRVEREEVFADSHRLIFQLVADGSVSGLRVDHVDGLRNPEAYLASVREAAPDAHVVVEKVLAQEEELRASFDVQGTTGYDFIGSVQGLFVDTRSEEPMTALYHAFTGQSQSYADVVRSAKPEIMLSELAPDLERLTGLLVDICERYRRHRDRTRRELQEAIREVASAFSVYRTYVRPKAATETDGMRIAEAVADAGRRNPDIDAELLEFVGELLLMMHEGGPESEFAARFQQFTPAVMAKGVEDTAFYRYNRMVALNEVGDDPGRFGRSVEDFHRHCARSATAWPQTMVTLSTHDTKRSGDVRARLFLLSEIPAEWEAAVHRWGEHNDRHRSQGYPDRNLEYLAYQTLVGAWPIDAARLKQFLQKASREAKVHTSWVNPVAAYDEAVGQFVDRVMTDAEFLDDFQNFIGRNQLVAHGRTNSLAQTALMLTCPGVPDLYQGTELWDLSLVDPDNRRPVDYRQRRRLLEEVRSAQPADVLARSDDGAPKLWLVARLLHERRARPELFNGAGYAQLSAVGQKALHAVAFVRDRLLVVVPRLVIGLAGDWGDTTIEVPRGRWRDVLTGKERPAGAAVPLAELLADFPVAVLSREAR